MANRQSSEEKCKSLARTITDLMNNQPLKYKLGEKLKTLDFVVMYEVMNMVNEKDQKITEEEYKSMYSSLINDKEINKAMELWHEKERKNFGFD